MSATTITAGDVRVRTTRPTESLPAWAIVGLGLAGMGLAVATFRNDTFLMAGLGLVLGGFAAIAVLRHRNVGVMIILSTMLVSYPAAIRGVGPLTINNFLGFSFLVILGFQLYKTRDLWFLREPEIRMLILIALWFFIGRQLSQFFLPEVRNMLPKTSIGRGVTAEYGGSDDGGRWLFELTSRLAWVLFLLHFIKTKRQLLWVLYTLFGCIVLVIPTLGPEMANNVGSYRITSKVIGWATNINRFAFMVNVGISLAIYLAMRTTNLWARGFCLLCAAGFVPLILLTASRSGFLGLGMVGLMIINGRQVPRRTKSVAATVGLALALFGFFFVIGDEARERLLNINPFAAEKGVEGSHSTEQRMETLEGALDIISRYPLTGIGLANFRWVNMYLHGSWKPPHNSYVWSAAEGGIAMTLFYLTLFAFLYRRIADLRVRYVDDPVLPHLPEWLFAYLSLLLFFSIFADVWLEVHVYFVVAFCLALQRFADEEDAIREGRPGLVPESGPIARRARIEALYARRPA